MAMTKALQVRLLTSSLEQLPRHGFTAAAGLAVIHSSRVCVQSTSTARRSGSDTSASSSCSSTLSPEDVDLLQGYTPARLEHEFASLHGGQSFSEALFQHWDTVSLHTSTEQTKKTLSQRSTGKRKASTLPGPERESLESVVSGLEERIVQSSVVRRHLLAALANHSSLPFGPFQSFLSQPLASMLPSAIPTPLPLLNRASRVADEMSHGLGWKASSFGPAWYAHRTRLTMAYLAAELHLVSPLTTQDTPIASAFTNQPTWSTINAEAHTPRKVEGGSSAPKSELSTESDAEIRTAAQPSIAILRRIALGGEKSVVADTERAVSVLGSVAMWAGRGWLGTFRSRGL